MNKTIYTVIKTEALTFSDEKDVFSILAVESDGETAFTEFAYDVARDTETANRIVTEIQKLSPPLSKFIDTLEELL